MSPTCKVLCLMAVVTAVATVGCCAGVMHYQPPLSFITGGGEWSPPSPRVISYEANVHRFEMLMRLCGACFIAFWVSILLLLCVGRRSSHGAVRGFPLDPVEATRK